MWGAEFHLIFDDKRTTDLILNSLTSLTKPIKFLVIVRKVSVMSLIQCWKKEPIKPRKHLWMPEKNWKNGFNYDLITWSRNKWGWC